MSWTCWMRRRLWVPFAVAIAVTVPGRAIAHGTQIEYRSTQALEVQAAYDSGEPMANAQVTVYSPENPSEPWLTGMTDEQGRFTFTPDPDVTGNWDVQVRQAGHGDMISIPLEEIDEPEATRVTPPVNASSEGVSPAQKALMAGSVVWGLVGTALFFSSRSKKHAHS